jgi:hypothetical protein
MEDSQQRLSEQCFLLSFIDEFIKLNSGSTSYDYTDEEAAQNFVEDTAEQLNRAGTIDADQFEMVYGNKIYQNFVCMMTKNPASMVNRLVTDRGLQELFNLTPAQMAAVMPKIKFYKMMIFWPK